jgi:AraC family transcriptional regulator of adaptative response / methylphosphotriester-DNA alkyltransferase methyltransferase
MALTDNEKWNAIVGCDESYNNHFFYGVRASKVFCNRRKCYVKDRLSFISVKGL